MHQCPIEIFWDQNQGSSTWGSRDNKRFRPRHTYKMTNFLGVFRNQGVMKRGKMQKKVFRFLKRLSYFPFYRTIVLNVKYSFDFDYKIFKSESNDFVM